MIFIFKRILKIVVICILIASLGILFKLLVWDTHFSNQTNQEAQEIYHSESVPIEQKFTSLENLNSDICGWIRIDGTKIDYPVVKSSKDDPTYYLSHNFKGEESKYGSILVDPNCSLLGTCKNITLYGHHMADGQMFADLMKFSDVEFCKQHPIIEFNTNRETANWKIISVFKTNTLSSQGELFNYTVSDFKSDKDFVEFVNQVIKRSLVDMGIDVNQNDKLITLSTCSYEFESFRTVVVARKIRKGESTDIDTSSVVKASNPLMPRCWYEKYGGSAPS